MSAVQAYCFFPQYVTVCAEARRSEADFKHRSVLVWSLANELSVHEVPGLTEHDVHVSRFSMQLCLLFAEDYYVFFALGRLAEV